MTAKILQFKRKEMQLFTEHWIACGRCGYNGYAQHYDCGPEFETVPLCECELKELQNKAKVEKIVDSPFTIIYNWFKRKR